MSLSPLGAEPAVVRTPHSVPGGFIPRGATRLHVGRTLVYHCHMNDDAGRR
jgi:hypothetical protein